MYDDWRRMAAQSGSKTRDGGYAAPPGAPFHGRVEAVNPQDETAAIEGFHGSGLSGKPVTHPYLGMNSWIRVMPEPGTGVLAAFRHDTEAPYIQNYHHETAGRVQKYLNEDVGLYRDLNPGELHLKSSGHAEAFFSDRGDLDLRGGLSRLSIRNSDMEIEQKTVLHRRSLRHASHLSLGHEERFGAVRRKGLVVPAASRWMPNAEEYYRSLGTLRPNVGGGVLAEHHEGDLFDSEGLPMTGGPINSPMRAYHRYGTEAGSALSVEIDVAGSVLVEMPETAVGGLHVRADSSPLDIRGLSVNLNSPTGVTVTTTGSSTTSLIMLDGIPWGTHVHSTPFGPSGPPIGL